MAISSELRPRLFKAWPSPLSLWLPSTSSRRYFCSTERFKANDCCCYHGLLRMASNCCTRCWVRWLLCLPWLQIRTQSESRVESSCSSLSSFQSHSRHIAGVPSTRCITGSPRSILNGPASWEPQPATKVITPFTRPMTEFKDLAAWLGLTHAGRTKCISWILIIFPLYLKNWNLTKNPELRIH